MYKLVEIFTDGACRGNPGPGGWGALLRYRDQEKLLKGGEHLTTNNRMVLTTDSKYVMEGIGQWLANWKRCGWKTAAHKPVKNEDLWRRLDAASGRHRVEWRWIKGHSG